MKIALFIIAVLLGLAASYFFYVRYRIINTSDKQNFEAAIDSEVEKSMKKGVFQGIVVGAYKDGTTFIKGYGNVNKESSQVPNAETVFQIGSISKLLTALLLQRLCDEGVVSMDATLGELLSESIVLSSSVRNVTLQQLVTHTSGFPRIPKSLIDKMTEMAGDDDPMRDPYSYLGPKYVFDYLASAEGKRKAGRFEYSNYGMGLLAHVLEVVTGEDYESMVREKVLLPLGMHHTAITLTPEMKAKLAQGYTAQGLPTPVWTFAALGGAGAYSSTAEDLMTFIQTSVAENGLASQLLQKMSEPQFKGNTGIGWMQPSFIDRFVGNRGVVWHDGRVGGYASYLAIDKQSGAGVVVLTNQAIAATGMLGMMLMRQARTQSWASSPPSHQSM
ncbi:MAG: serine hydrolase domain-containing protein [Cyanobacteria bacterium P01_E01_bin.42]